MLVKVGYILFIIMVFFDDDVFFVVVEKICNMWGLVRIVGLMKYICLK